MALIDCHVQNIPFSDLEALVLVEKRDCCFTYQGHLQVLSQCLPRQEDVSVKKDLKTLYFALWLPCSNKYRAEYSHTSHLT